jgi:beta-lactamase class D
MKAIFILFMVFYGMPSLAENYQINQQIDALFRNAKVQGTFIVHDVQGSSYIVHNITRAKKRYVPASTFKILHSLIGLSVGAVKDVNEPLPYGGMPQPIKSWEKDMGLREAIKISNVPIYKELARRIGLERMRVNLQKVNYGNHTIGNSVDTFWLEGPLKISAVEQTLFLAHLAHGRLFFSKENQSIVREIIKLEKGDDWILYGKTGWAKDIGWWVGWVEKKGKVYSFAVNIDMSDIKDAPKRVELGKAGLRILGIIN